MHHVNTISFNFIRQRRCLWKRKPAFRAGLCVLAVKRVASGELVIRFPSDSRHGHSERPSSPLVMQINWEYMFISERKVKECTINGQQTVIAMTSPANHCPSQCASNSTGTSSANECRKTVEEQPFSSSQLPRFTYRHFYISWRFLLEKFPLLFLLSLLP